MKYLRLLWSWCFDVSRQDDPKLRGWLHPAFALIFNTGLAFAVACAAFLAAPTHFHEEWLQRQSPAVIRLVQQAKLSSAFIGYEAVPLWLIRAVRRVLVPDELLVDQQQAFALYAWTGGSVQPQYIAAMFLLYVALMITCRLYEKGPVMLYDAAWACNLSMGLAAVAIWLNVPFLVSACSCWVAVDQLLWYIDLLLYLIRGRFLVGVAKYVANKETPWMKKLFSTHHLWFIPFTTYINLKYAKGHSPCCLSVAMALSLCCVLGSRCCTPYAVAHPTPLPEQKHSTGHNRHEERERSASKNGSPNKAINKGNKGNVDVLNVNVAWRCWADVTHHVPLLGAFDDKPWFMFLVWNQLVWGLGNCILFGILLTACNLLRSN